MDGVNKCVNERSKRWWMFMEWRGPGWNGRIASPWRNVAQEQEESWNWDWMLGVLISVSTHESAQNHLSAQAQTTITACSELLCVSPLQYPTWANTDISCCGEQCLSYVKIVHHYAWLPLLKTVLLYTTWVVILGHVSHILKMFVYFQSLLVQKLDDSNQYFVGIIVTYSAK